MQIRVIFALPSLVPPPLVPWAAAPVAHPSIHHWARVMKICDVLIYLQFARDGEDFQMRN